MRSSRQFRASFFLLKDFERTKSQIKQNQPTKTQTSVQENIKGNNFLCIKTSKRGKIVYFSFLKKKLKLS